MLNEALLAYHARTIEAAPVTTITIITIVGMILLALVAIGLFAWGNTVLEDDLYDGKPIAKKILGIALGIVVVAGGLVALALVHFDAKADRESILEGRDQEVVQALESEYGVILAEENVGKLLDDTCERTEEGCEPVVATLADGSKKLIQLVRETDESWVLAVEGNLLQPLAVSTE